MSNSCEYVQAANKFLADNEITIKFHFLGLHKPKCGREAVNTYNVIIINSDGDSKEFPFYNSIHATRNGEEPTNYDILACLYLDSSVDYEDFCDNYGYEQFIECENTCEIVRNPFSWGIYCDVQEQDQKLKALFTESQLEQLAEIN